MIFIKLIKQTPRFGMHLVTSILASLLLISAEQIEMIWMGTLTAAAWPEKSSSLSTFPLFSSLMDFLGRDAKNLIFLFIVLTIPVALYKSSFMFLSRYLAQRLSIQVSAFLRERYFAHLQRLPMSFFHSCHIGELASRVTQDSSDISLALHAYIRNLILTPIQILSTSFLCLYLSWKLSLFLFVLVPCIAIIFHFLRLKVRKTLRLLQKDQELFSNLVFDFLNGIQTIKIFSMEAFSLKKYSDQNEKMRLLETKSARYDLMSRPITHCMTTLLLASVIVSGLYFFEMSLADLLIFCGSLTLSYEPLKRFTEENGMIQKGTVAAERMEQILSIEPSIQDIVGAKVVTSLENKIEFCSVSFRYQDQWILKNVSFEVKKGETVAIIGSTGSGKSTLLQLLPRLYEVTQGDILIDGVSIKEIEQNSLRSLISFVSQRPFIFYDTVASNISYGRPLSDDAIWKAAKKAHADEFISQYPEGLKTRLSPSTLSGGQQQRVAIARALVKEAPILLLDEATSSLDSVSELKVQEAIEGLKGEITQIIVAHRLSTIEHADRIIVLEQGKKVGEGSLDFLYNNCDPFKKMWDIHQGRRNRDGAGRI